MPTLTVSFLGEGSPTKIDHRKKGTLTLTSLLEDLGMGPRTRAQGAASRRQAATEPLPNSSPRAVPCWKIAESHQFWWFPKVMVIFKGPLEKGVYTDRVLLHSMDNSKPCFPTFNQALGFNAPFFTLHLTRGSTAG